MGKSKSIQTQQATNKSFDEYVKEMNKDMDVYIEQVRHTIQTMVDAHYQPFPDKALLLEGQYTHLSTISEWSLNSVNVIIDGCRKALFGAPPPGEVTKTEPVPEVKTAVDAIKTRELLIANAAFDVIQGILCTFTASTKTSVATKIDAKPLSPGLSLFIAVMNNAYTRKDFFNGESIDQTMYLFKVYYSIKEGQSVSKLSDLESFEDQKVAWREKIKQLNSKVIDLDILADDYAAQLKKYTDISDTLNQQLKKLDTAIADLAPASLKASPKAVEVWNGDALVRSMRGRLKAIGIS